MRAFVETPIKPYYLHHADLAPGTAICGLDRRGPGADGACAAALGPLPADLRPRHPGRPREGGDWREWHAGGRRRMLRGHGFSRCGACLSAGRADLTPAGCLQTSGIFLHRPPQQTPVDGRQAPRRSAPCRECRPSRRSPETREPSMIALTGIRNVTRSRFSRPRWLGFGNTAHRRPRWRIPRFPGSPQVARLGMGTSRAGRRTAPSGS